MILECVRAFGNFKPGDQVEVPDGTIVFDHFYFKQVVEASTPPVPVDAPTISAVGEVK